MNDLSETITSYLLIRDILKSSNYEPKLIDAAVTLLEHYIDKQDKVFNEAWTDVVGRPGTIQDMKHDALYSDDPAYTENDKEQIYKNYRAAIDEYNQLKQEFDQLQTDYEQLQDLFYRVDSECDELKVKYDQSLANYRAVVASLKEAIEERMVLEHQLDEVKEYDC